MAERCYYHSNTPGPYEKGHRLKLADLALTPCTGKLKPVSLRIEQLSIEINLQGCESVLELLNLRANGEIVDERDENGFGSREICDDHFDNLVLNWEKRSSRSLNNRQRLNCGNESRSNSESYAIKCPLTHQKTVAAESRRVVNKAMCLQYLRKEGTLVPPGTNVCKRHQSAMKDSNDKFREKTDPDFDPTEELTTELDAFCVETADDIDDIDNVVSAVVQLVTAIGGDRVLTRGEWSGLAENTKRKKGSLASRIFHAVCEVITPDGKDDLYARATAQPKIGEDRTLAARIFDAIDERFTVASSRQEKIELISLVSDLGLTMRETIRCVPSATLHYLNQAKIHNRGGLNFDKDFRRERFDERKNDRFVDFLTRSNALVSLSWGDTLATRSDGTKVPIASMARKYTFARIHRMYLRDLENSNEMHLKLSRGSTTRILKVLAKRKNERMECVDEFAVDAIEGWRRLTDVVEELRELHGLIGDEEERALKRWIRISKSHLECEYLAEISESSNVRQHCTKFALSDRQRKCFASKCDHDHDGACVNCDQMDLLLTNLTALTNRLSDEAKANKSIKFDRIDRLHQMAEFSCLNIRAFQAHLLRTALSNHGRTLILDNLKDGEALVTLDFGILPQKAIEGQSDFYAKKGITLHITHVLAKIGGKMVDHVFAHTLDDTKQDAALVFGIVRHSLGILETKGISKVYLRSDNAGSYKSGPLISSLFNLSSSSMIIAGYYFSESQSGKGACDRTCAHCKRKMNEWISSGKNICSGCDIFHALTVDHEIVKGLSTYYCTFTDSSSKFLNLLPGISQFYAFDFEDTGIRSRCQFGIGDGSVTKKEKLPSLTCTLNIEKEGGHTEDSFWSIIEVSNSEKSSIVEEEEEEGEDTMFHCSTQGCTSSFRSERWLRNHETVGKHAFVVKRESMTDRAIDKFNELIESRETARIAVTEHVESIGGPAKSYDYLQGWSLKAEHANEGLDETARRHAVEYFNIQRASIPPKRAEPATMRKRLEDAKNPTDPSGHKYLLEYSKIPSEKQLQSLFSRLEQSRVKDSKITTAKAAKVPKTAKGIGKSITKSARSTASVRSTKGGTRKRNVVVESEGESNGESIEEEEEEEKEILREHEHDFIRKIIEEEGENIFL